MPLLLPKKIVCSKPLPECAEGFGHHPLLRAGWCVVCQQERGGRTCAWGTCPLSVSLRAQREVSLVFPESPDAEKE